MSTPPKSHGILYKYRNALRSGRFSVILQLFGGNFFCGLFGKSLEIIPV